MIAKYKNNGKLIEKLIPRFFPIIAPMAKISIMNTSQIDKYSVLCEHPSPLNFEYPTHKLNQF